MDVTALKTLSARPDDELVREVLAGKCEAYADLVRRYERIVHAAAWAIVRNHHAAQDVAQETFIKAHRGLASLRRPKTFGPWLITIARRTATDLARGKKHPIPVPDLPDVPSPEESAETDSAFVLSALERLPDHEQQVLLLRYFDELPVAGIAALLGSSVGTITKRLSRGLSHLREQLKETP
jgi:RNA polymerase sigma-70 factor (ECF subfamily)